MLDKIRHLGDNPAARLSDDIGKILGVNEC